MKIEHYRFNTGNAVHHSKFGDGLIRSCMSGHRYLVDFVKYGIWKTVSEDELESRPGQGEYFHSGS